MMEEIIVTSLRSTPERLKSFRKAWNPEAVNPLVFDGLTWPLHVPRPNFYARGTVGCTMSHLACVRFAKMMGWDRVLLLEDDARPEPKFLRRLAAALEELPSDWSVVWIGATVLNLAHNETRTFIPALECSPGSAIALMVNPNAHGLLNTLDTLTAPPVCLYRKMPGAYALREPLAWHAGGVSTITGNTLPDLRVYPITGAPNVTCADIPKTPSQKTAEKRLSSFFADVDQSTPFNEVFTSPAFRTGVFHFIRFDDGSRVIPVIGKSGSTSLKKQYCWDAKIAHEENLTDAEWHDLYQAETPEIIVVMRDPFARLLSILNFEFTFKGASYNQAFLTLMNTHRNDKTAFIKNIMWWIYQSNRTTDIYDMHIVSQTKSFLPFVNELPFTVYLIDDLELGTHANGSREHRFTTADLEKYRDVITALFKADYDFLRKHYHYTGSKHAVQINGQKSHD